MASGNRSNNIISRLFHWAFPREGRTPGLNQWRRRILFALWLFGLTLGFLALIPSVYLALREGRAEVAAIDVAFYLGFVSILLGRSWSLELRAALTVGMLYTLGLGLLVSLGPYGAGYVWLFSAAVLCGLLLGRLATMIAIGMNIGAVLLIAGLILSGSLPWAVEMENAMARWLITGVSLILLNALIAVSAFMTLKGLRTTLDEKQAAGEKLGAMNERLLTEMAVRLDTETALRKSEELFRELIEHSSVPAVVFNPGGDTEFVNLAFTETYGWKREDLPAMRDWRKMFTETDNNCGVPQIEDANMQPGRMVCRDGTDRDVICHADTLPDGRYHAEIMDVTELNRAVNERINLEAQLRQAQKMEAIGNLAGGIAHDFNNILTVILGETELAAVSEREPCVSCRRMKAVEQAGERAAMLTRQLLAFSRKQVVHPRVLDPGAVIREMKKMLSRLIGEDIEMTFDLADDVRPVEVDEGQLGQVVMNLAANARDAMPEGGRLTIQARNADLEPGWFERHGAEGEPGRYVLLSVSDTGPGMDRETLSRVFEPFFTTKPRDKGTGLGLSTVYGIVKQAGGYVWAYSEPGLGTTFKIYLPAAEKEITPAAAVHRSVEDVGRGETILLVEDDESVRRLTRKTLEHKGFRVIDAADGEAALELLEKDDDVRLLLTDVVMPRMNGPQVAEAVRRRRPAVRIVYMSGYIDDAVTRAGLGSSGGDLLEKPFSPEKLGRTIRAALDREG